MSVSQSQALCLKLHSHRSDLVDSFHSLFNDESLVDVTLSCGGGSLKTHKLVLSAASPYFKSIFTGFTNPAQYPVIFMRDIPFTDLKAIVEFMYRGEVTVSEGNLPSLLSSARALKVKGLLDIDANTCSVNQSPAGTSHGFSFQPLASRGSERKRKRRRRYPAKKDIACLPGDISDEDGLFVSEYESCSQSDPDADPEAEPDLEEMLFEAVQAGLTLPSGQQKPDGTGTVSKTRTRKRTAKAKSPRALVFTYDKQNAGS